MDQTFKMDGFRLREATERDFPQLSIHHRKMFEEIGSRKGQEIADSVAAEIEQAYSRKLSEDLPAGRCRSWLIETGNVAVASGAISIVSFVPTPSDVSSRVAYLHSMYTEKEARGRNFAFRIVQAALAYCKTEGIRRVLLTASEAGRPVYERIGFSPYPEMMRIFIE